MPPQWVKDAIFYQIFPDRFANGDPSNDPVNVVPWGSPPPRFKHMGGDIQGIIDKMDYLLDLGINAIYLTPIFLSASNHKYFTYNYYEIDPRFGTLDLFLRFLNIAHSSGIKVVLDGVFHHCGRGFYPFHDVLENQRDSPYVDWFLIQEYPLNAYGDHKYATWAGAKEMPKFNILNKEARQYILDIARYWTNLGIDGWRLDAVKHLDDRTFWNEFRENVLAVNPEAYLCGEVWEEGGTWLTGDKFDGTTNYALRGAILDYFVYKSINTQQFVVRIQHLLSIGGWSSVQSMYNLLGSHDTTRLFTLAKEDTARVNLAYLFLFTYPGAPAIYYGDEIGITGGQDPDNRKAMPWDKSQWNLEIRRHIQKLISIRKNLNSLRHGTLQWLWADDLSNSCVFSRKMAEETVVVAINCGNRPSSITIPLKEVYTHDISGFIDQISGQRILYNQDELILSNLAPDQGMILSPF